ncbi:hypothetical protein [Halomonas getboli]|uniref:hypothetical protein n=1 Tax=Halomonas getboli TaxID=2935862 RepID=UPI001FFF3B44|nr:hypothetical protein [Halomonas getboli]MCK2183092.1 hypothetical protein [Halomonas getboli]
MNQVLRLTHTPVEQRPLPQARPMRRGKCLEHPLRTRARPHGRVEVGCLAHAPHEDLGLGDLSNAQRRLDFYARWHGLTEPRLKIWKAC